MEWYQTESDDKEKDDVESAISKHQDNTGPFKNPTNVCTVTQASAHFSLLHETYEDKIIAQELL